MASPSSQFATDPTSALACLPRASLHHLRKHRAEDPLPRPGNCWGRSEVPATRAARGCLGISWCYSLPGIVMPTDEPPSTTSEVPVT